MYITAYAGIWSTRGNKHDLTSLCKLSQKQGNAIPQSFYGLIWSHPPPTTVVIFLFLKREGPWAGNPFSYPFWVVQISFIPSLMVPVGGCWPWTKVNGSRSCTSSPTWKKTFHVHILLVMGALSQNLYVENSPEDGLPGHWRCSTLSSLLWVRLLRPHEDALL